MKGKLTTKLSKKIVVLCRENGRVTCFVSIGDAFLNRAGTTEDWAYNSPKSVCVWSEGRGMMAGSIIDKARNLSKLLAIPLVDLLTKQATRP